MSTKNRLKIFTKSNHPYIGVLVVRLRSLGVVIVDTPSEADMCLIGGDFNSVDDHIDTETPVLLLSSHLLYKGTACPNFVDESLPYSFHPLADFALEAYKYITSETYYLNVNPAPCMVIRTFPIYGTSSRYAVDSLVDRLVHRAHNCEPYIDPEYGYRKRSYLHIDDLINGFDALMKAFLHGQRGIYNLGSDKAITIKELYHTVWSLAGLDTSSPLEEDLKDFPWRPNVLVPDLTRTKAVTKWSPKITLRSGISECLQFKRDLMAGVAYD